VIPRSLLYKLVKRDPGGKLPGLIVAEGSKREMRRLLKLRGGEPVYFVAMGSPASQIGQFFGNY